MKSDISKSKRGGKTAYLKIGVWYEPRSGHIHITLPRSSWFHTTVTDDPKSKRGHPSLFGNLARALKKAEVPHPEVPKGKKQ